jgi:hypothetical protein
MTLAPAAVTHFRRRLAYESGKAVGPRAST